MNTENKNFYMVIDLRNRIQEMMDIGKELGADKITWDVNGSFYFWKNDHCFCVADKMN